MGRCFVLCVLCFFIFALVGWLVGWLAGWMVDCFCFWLNVGQGSSFVHYYLTHNIFYVRYIVFIDIKML